MVRPLKKKRFFIYVVPYHVRFFSTNYAFKRREGIVSRENLTVWFRSCILDSQNMLQTIVNNLLIITPYEKYSILNCYSRLVRETISSRLLKSWQVFKNYKWYCAWGCKRNNPGPAGLECIHYTYIY